MSGFFAVVVLVVGLAMVLLGLVVIMRAIQRNARNVDPLRLFTRPRSSWRHPFGTQFLYGAVLLSAGIILFALGVRLLR